MQKRTMSTTEIVDAYFDGWNAHEPAEVAALFASGGTYEDPTTEGPVGPEAVPGIVARLCELFPYLAFEPASSVAEGRRRVVEWVLRGRNLVPIAEGVSPTGKWIALGGVDVFEVGDEGIESVRRYFDQRSFYEQIGMMVLVQPFVQGAAKFGYSMRVASENRHPPGAVALTWIQGADEQEKERIRAHSRQNVEDFLEEPGFVSIVTGFIGLRGFTVTAWEDEASLKRALAGHHVTAMKQLFGERFVSSVWTSVWEPTRINRLWLRCPSCGSLQDVSDDHASCSQCDAPLPERPAFW